MSDNENDYINLIDVETRARVLRTQEVGHVTASMFKATGRLIIGIFAAMIRVGEKINECNELNAKVRNGKAVNIKDHFV